MRWARIISTRIMNSCCKCLEGWTYPSLGESDGERANKFLLAAGQNLCQPRKRHLCGVSSNPLLRVFRKTSYILLHRCSLRWNRKVWMIFGDIGSSPHRAASPRGCTDFASLARPNGTSSDESDDLAQLWCWGVLRSPLCTEPQATGKWPSCRNAGI